MLLAQSYVLLITCIDLIINYVISSTMGPYNFSKCQWRVGMTAILNQYDHKSMGARWSLRGVSRVGDTCVWTLLTYLTECITYFQSPLLIFEF